MEKRSVLGSKKARIILAASLALAVIVIVLCAFFLSTVSLAGNIYGRNERSLDLSGQDISDDVDELLKMRKLENVDLTDSGITAEQYDMIAERFSDCEIKWSVPLGGETYPNDIESLILSEDTDPTELKNLKYFNALKSLDATAYPLCDELYDATLAVSSSDCDYMFAGTLYGAEVTSETEKLDLSDKEITDVSEFYQKLRFFPGITEVFAGDCQVSDDEMDELNHAFPNTNIVWLVEFGIWQVRTDIRVFSTLVGKNQPKTFTQEEFYPLLNYCTELRALDLGHNRKVDDLNGFSKLTKLEVLFLPGTSISDLSALKYFPNLHYMEIFYCDKVEDLSPLGECQNLEELEMQRMGNVKNLSALENCKKLKMLFGYYSKPVDYSWWKLRKNMPDCWINTKDEPAFGGWRSTDKNQAIKTAFNHWDKVVTYNSWDDVTYSEEVTLAPKHW